MTQKRKVLLLLAAVAILALILFGFLLSQCGAQPDAPAVPGQTAGGSGESQEAGNGPTSGDPQPSVDTTIIDGGNLGDEADDELPEPTVQRPGSGNTGNTGNTDPKPTEAGPTDPKPTEAGPTDPKPTEADPTDPKPTEADPTGPKPTEADPTDPDPTETDPGVEAPEDGDKFGDIF